MSPGRSHRAALVEAFTTQPLAGNGAGVVLLEEPASAAWMQALAGSLAQSETAFLLPSAGDWLLRWFTPRCEVPLCGHASLAAVLALGHWGLLGPGQGCRLRTRSGVLEARLEGADQLASLCLPSGDLEPAAPSPQVLEWIEQQLDCPVEACWGSSIGYRVLLLPDRAPLAQLGGLPPGLPSAERRGLVLMQALSPGSGLQLHGEAVDYQLRFFAPDLGIPEDPVTGSAHALVAPYWMERLGRQRIRGWQCSARGGGMLCERHSCAIIRLWGQGHLLWIGELHAGWDPGDAGSWTCWPGQASAGSG